MATKSKLSQWHKFGRFITGVVILAFFLPFFGVSCQGIDVVTVSGADMVGGCKPGGMLADTKDRADDVVEDTGAPNTVKSSKKPGLDKVEREPLAIIALALAIVGFGLAWVRTRGALIGSLVVALAGLGTLAGLYVKVNGVMKDAVEAELKSKSGDSGEDRMGSRISKEADIDAGGRMGLWLAGLALLSTAGLAGLALRERQEAGGMPVAAAGPGPGPGPMPPQ